MRRKWGELITMLRSKTIFVVILLTLCSLQSCEGSRRAQRRKDSSRALYSPEPSAESLQQLAQSMGAAGFQQYTTEGKTLVKRLIPADSQPDLDVIEHQGVIGRAGVDFPAFPNIPTTGFNCRNVPTGYYADLETDCQVFHICDTSRKISFLCPNGTIFSQSHLICDWWFKVDCASAPALYESSAEYYSNEQKKSQKITQSLTKNVDLQQLQENYQAESRRTSVNLPTSTEKLLRHRQKLHSSVPVSVPVEKATSRSYKTYFDDSNFAPTQRSQATTSPNKRGRNLVQLINNFGNTPKPTAPSFDPTFRTTQEKTLREMQVAAESAAFASNNNRQYLQDFNKNYRPYPVYTPNVPKQEAKTKTNPTLTTLYNFRDRTLKQQPEITTKRPENFLPYTQSFNNFEKREPYTRPGVSLLKDYLGKEKNKTVATTTEKIRTVTDRSDYLNKNTLLTKFTVENKNNFESVTKIPQTTRVQDYFPDMVTSERFIGYSPSRYSQATTEPTYQERRERLLRKLKFDPLEPTEPTIKNTDKYYGSQPNRPGLIVPPSLTPKTLHSLAIYYATGVDNLSTTTASETTETATTPFDEYETIEDGIPALFSRHTLKKYSKLFNQDVDNSDLIEEIKSDPNATYNELAEDLMVQQSQNPLATSPQIRELAQVFTHALSAYLQDPVQFRKVLSDIRPTHPSFGDMLTVTEDPSNTDPTTTINEEDDEILGFSDDNKIRPVLASLRDGKSLNIATDYTLVSEDVTTAIPYIETTTAAKSTSSNPFRCCGRISASYTSASTPYEPLTTPFSIVNPVATNINSLRGNFVENIVSTTEDSYTVQKYAGFKNNSDNSSPYGKEAFPTNSKPLSEYEEVTNLPTAWGVDVTSAPTTNSEITFESKKLKVTTDSPAATTPVYFTESASIELENEEELQRAHSQSFISPQNNNIRHGKQLYLEHPTTSQKLSEDLAAPTVANFETTTLNIPTQPPTTFRIDVTDAPTTVVPVSNSIFTSPADDRTTGQFQWPSTLESWQSTIVDPITLNDDLSPPALGLSLTSYQSGPTNNWSQNTATTPTDYFPTTEQTFASSNFVAQTTPVTRNDERVGRLLNEQTSTEVNQDITTMTETFVEKAKEIMGEMNSTTTQKLMNVMKKTKSKTVKRLILLLVQTCDDDHNVTAEASKKALLEALMAVSQKDMDEIAKEQGVKDLPASEEETLNKQEKTAEIKEEVKDTEKPKLENEEVKSKTNERKGKSLNFEASAINSLTNYKATVSSTTELYKETTVSPRTTTAGRRGTKKFLIRTSPIEPKTTGSTYLDNPISEARIAPTSGSDVKSVSDTRALELLRSLYTIAAKWG